MSFDIRVYVVFGAEAAGQANKMKTLAFNAFVPPRRSSSTYLEVVFFTLGITLLSGTIAVPESVLAPAMAGVILMRVAPRSRKQKYAIESRMSRET